MSERRITRSRRSRYSVRRWFGNSLFIISAVLSFSFISLTIQINNLLSTQSFIAEGSVDDVIAEVKFHPRNNLRQLEKVDVFHVGAGNLSRSSTTANLVVLQPAKNKDDIRRKVEAKSSSPTAGVTLQEKAVVSGEHHVQGGRLPPVNDTSHRVKYLIYLCDGARSCGGWGDRQRGLVSAFLLANVTGRRFGINMTVPCDITNYYLPNKVNWRVCPRAIKNRSHRVINGIDNTDFHKTLLKIDFEKVYQEDVIYLRTNVEHYWSIRSNPHFTTRLPRWAKVGRPAFFREAWNILMKPSSYLQSHLQRVLTASHYYNRTSPFVCAHIRIGRSKSNPRDSETRNDVSQLGSLWGFLQSYVTNGSHVFLATDNTEVRELSRKKFGSFHHDSGGMITHIDKRQSGKDACVGFEYALLDQLVLTNCDVLVMSHSMFGSRAAYVRGSQNGLYYYQNGTIEKIRLK